MNGWNFIINHHYLALLTIAVLVMLVYEEMLTHIMHQWLVSVEGAVELINHQNAAILDLRNASNFDKGHLLGAKSVTKQQLLAQMKDIKVAVLILNDEKELLALKKDLRMATQNQKQIKILQGGINAWQEAGLPLVR